jgi:hypothetical protein
MAGMRQLGRGGSGLGEGGVAQLTASTRSLGTHQVAEETNEPRNCWGGTIAERRYGLSRELQKRWAEEHRSIVVSVGNVTKVRGDSDGDGDGDVAVVGNGSGNAKQR